MIFAVAERWSVPESCTWICSRNSLSSC